MRIIVSGCTNQQCGRNTLIKYEAVSTVFARALYRCGATVEHRPYEPGEDLSDVDGVFLGVVPFFSVAGHYVNAMLLALKEAEEKRVPVVLYLDDWRFTQLFSNIKSILKGNHQLVKPFFDNRAHSQLAKDRLPELIAVIQRLQDEPWPVTLAPAFSWGDHSILGKELPFSQDVVYADISSLAEEYPAPELFGERRRAWVLGTVTDQLAWLDSLGLAWPLDHLGGKASKAPAKVHEADLVARYHQSWGVLSPPYKKILASGWWRNRFVHAARGGAVLLCDPGEAPQLGAPYSLTPAYTEAMSDHQLRELAAAQRGAFQKATLGPVEAAFQVMSALELAKKRLG